VQKAGNKFPSSENRRINGPPSPPLIISPPDIDTAFRANMDKDYKLLDPRIIDAARALNMSISQAKEATAAMSLSLLQILGIEEAPKGKIALQYVLRGPLISPEEEAGLSTHMRNLVSWYKEHINKEEHETIFYGRC
jgi:hypothetical protein